MSQRPAAPDLLDTVLAMTRSRERAEVDALLLAALGARTGAVRVRLWRVKGEVGSAQHWMLCGEQHPGHAGVTLAERLDDAARTLVPWHDRPDLVRCAEAGVALTTAQTAAPGWHTGWPLFTDAGDALDGLVELDTAAPPDVAVHTEVQRLLQAHRNVLGLLDYSERDTLTRLLNRKRFDTAFMHATVAEARRIYGAPDDDSQTPDRRAGVVVRRHWLGVIDIDHFKLVNDRFGHTVGDEVLSIVGRIMESVFRFDDQLYRFGGEEFVVLLTARGEAGAMTAFERFRHAIASCDFPAIHHVTVSIGFSDVRPGDTPQACFDRADKAVYHGKLHGRNQTHSHEVLVAQGRIEDTSHCGEIELF
jgi:diguanylate cyclase (GGDEF)-like protein